MYGTGGNSLTITFTFMERFILIDGNAILHRAYHALPPLTSSSGEVVSAVYGFFSMFLKIIEDLKPAHIAVCFDRAKPTFRQEMYVGYHATRPKLADDFVPQIILVHDALEKMGVSIFELDGYEADDLIGTLAFQAFQNTEYRIQKTCLPAGRTDSGKTEITDKTDSVSSVLSAISFPSSVLSPLEVIIVSGDRDLLQLVNSHVRVLAPIVGLKNTVLYDEQKVEEKYGVKPSQIVDYKALVGDASDNYPGVAGIGPKTASNLLKKYKTFENLYKNLGELPPKISERLATDTEQASLAKKLATVVCDAPIRLDIEKCNIKGFDVNKAKEFFEELGFNSLLKRVSKQQETSNKKQEKSPPSPKASEDKQLGLL